MQRATLEVKRGQRVGSQFPVGSRIVVGRDIGCDLQLFDEGLSRRHFMIESDNQGFRVEDLGSSNGTYVNGRRIQQARLAHGDLITSGSTQLQFWVAREPTSISSVRAPTSSGTPGQQARVSELVELVDEDDSVSTSQIKKRVDVGTLEWMTAVPSQAAVQQQASRALKVLYQVGNQVSAETQLGPLCESLTSSVLDVVNGDRAFLILYDPATNDMETVAASSKRERFAGRSKVSRTVVEDCVKRGISVLSADAMADRRFKAGESVLMQNIRSVMCVPVESNARVLGAIYVDNLSASGLFTEFDLELVSAIGKQAGVAIERARLVTNMQELFYGTIRTLVATLEAKDPYTHGHSERVTSYAVQIAQEMDLEHEEIDTIHLAGLLHDIGKVGISDKIINKPSRLTDEEFDIIKTHPVIGADIVRNIHGTEQVVEIVRHHHEKYDGSGYPDGLAGDEISLLTRILTVADSYDAMCSSRAYRKDFSTEEVLAEFERCAGTHFDPEVAAVFRTMVAEERLASITEVYERGLDSHFSAYFNSFQKRHVSSGIHRSLRSTSRKQRKKGLEGPDDTVRDVQAAPPEETARPVSESELPIPDPDATMITEVPSDWPPPEDDDQG